MRDDSGWTLVEPAVVPCVPAVLVAGHVEPGNGGQVLLYARPVSGDRFGIRPVRSGPAAGRRRCAGAIGPMTLEAGEGTAR